MACSGSTDERLNLKPEVWGKNMWDTLYAVALGYPNTPTDIEKNAAKNFIMSLQSLLPCASCRDNFATEIASNSIDSSLQCSDTFTKYIYDLQCRISTRLRKHKFTYDETVEHIINPKKSTNNQLNSFNLIWIISLTILITALVTWAVTKKSLKNKFIQL